MCQSVSDPETEITGPKMKDHLKKADIKEKLKEKINGESGMDGSYRLDGRTAC